LAVVGFLYKGSLEENGALEAKFNQQIVETTKVVDANVTLATTIDGLTADITALIAERKANTAQRERELTQRSDELLKAQAETERERRKRHDLMRETIQCEELTSTVVADVCPGIAASLQLRASGARSNEVEGSRAPD
jgi:Zn-dependent oligopeptidase